MKKEYFKRASKSTPFENHKCIDKYIEDNIKDNNIKLIILL